MHYYGDGTLVEPTARELNTKQRREDGADVQHSGRQNEPLGGKLQAADPARTTKERTPSENIAVLACL